jgi:hypothetical protein
VGAAALLVCSTALAQLSPVYIEANRAWYSCVTKHADEFVTGEFDPDDIAIAAMGSCAREQSAFFSAFVDDHVRKPPGRAESALEEFERIKTGMRWEIITRVVHIRFYGRPPPASVPEVKVE